MKNVDDKNPREFDQKYYVQYQTLNTKYSVRKKLINSVESENLTKNIGGNWIWRRLSRL